MSKVFELDKYQIDTYEFPLVLPTGEVKKDAKIVVRSESSEDVEKVQREIFLEGQTRRATKEKAKGKSDVIGADDLDYLEVVGLKNDIAYVAEIRGISYEGVEIGSNKELIAKVLKKYPWIRAQVLEASKEVKNFCRG